jgi:hypothetical protein
MSFLHPSVASVASLALCVLLGCERKSEGTSVANARPANASGLSVGTSALRAKEPAAGAPAAREPAGASAAPSSPPIGGPAASQSAASQSAASNPVPSSAAPQSPTGESDPVAVPRQTVSGEDGAPSETCIHGWTSPGRGSPLRKAALDMMRERNSERFVVLEIRYFRGPEDAEVMGPPREVERWYIKARSASRRGRAQRWLVRRAAVGSGIDAVAPFDSTGYGPGIWRRPDALDESLSDPFQRPCDRARAGEKCMGLPRQVLGCLQGT